MIETNLEDYVLKEGLIVVKENKNIIEFCKELYTIVLIGDKVDKDIKIGDQVVFNNGEDHLQIFFQIDNEIYSIINPNSILMTKKNNNPENN